MRQYEVTIMEWKPSELSFAMIVFGCVGLLLSVGWAIPTYNQSAQPLQTWQFLLVIPVSTVSCLFISGLLWKSIVLQFDRWSAPTRGALAGGFTVWLSIPVLALVLKTIPFLIQSSSATVNYILESGMAAVVAATIGFFLASPLIIIGVIVGYLLGRYQAPNRRTLPFISQLSRSNRQ